MTRYMRLQVLIGARDLLSDPAKWIKGRFAAAHQSGGRTHPDMADARCWCIVGAIQKVAVDKLGTDQGYGLANELQTSLAEELTNHPSTCRTPTLIDFNDNPQTQHGDIMDFLGRTIANHTLPRA